MKKKKVPYLKKSTKFKKILKKIKKPTVVIKEYETAEYKPIYFKQQYEEEKNKLFFK